ncbi:MAG: aa3-type cytochrome c oxidase subunit IV [Pseudorhizobium sp.]
MDDHNTAPVETGAQMDYVEHERTYERFLAASKWVTVHLVVLMIAMAAGFFGGAGFFGALFIFIVLNAAAIYLLR